MATFPAPCFWLTPVGRSLEVLTRHLPLGAAWDAFRYPGPLLSGLQARAYRMMSAIAKAYEDAWAMMCTLATELSPYTTVQMIGEWEKAVGLPDACLWQVTTLQQRRMQVIYRLSRRRWTTKGDWVDLARLFGLPVIILPGTIVSTYLSGGNDRATRILLPFDGTDGSTAISDIGSGMTTPGHVWACSGAAAISTQQAKFGGASAKFTGQANDSIRCPTNNDFIVGAGDFTVDGWFNANDAGGVQRYIFGQTDASATTTNTSVLLGKAATGQVFARVCIGSLGIIVTGVTQFTATINPGWHHAAFVRHGNALLLFVDGVLEATGTIVGTINQSTASVAIGSAGDFVSANIWNGWIDQMRLSVGTARWTAAFTPPTAPVVAGFAHAGSFRVYINVGHVAYFGYDYGLPFRGPGYPVPYGIQTNFVNAFQCIIDRIRPANVVVLWNAIPPALIPPDYDNTDRHDLNVAMRTDSGAILADQKGRIIIWPFDEDQEFKPSTK